MTLETLTPTQAQSEIARLGYWLEPDLECLGAEKRRGRWIFIFRLTQPAKGDMKVIEIDRDDLPSLLATVAWINRPEPVFDVVQMSFTSPTAWQQLQRLRREEPEEYYRLTHPKP